MNGPIVARTPTYYIDFHFSKANAVYEHTIPADWNTLVIVYEGKVKVQDEVIAESVQAVQLAREKDSAGILKIENLAERSCVVLLAGKPIDEPIAHYGPFVLNNKEQLMQAFDDFH